MLTEVYSVEMVGGFLSSDRLFFILLLAQAFKNLLAIGKLIAFLPTKMGEEPNFKGKYLMPYLLAQPPAAVGALGIGLWAHITPPKVCGPLFFLHPKTAASGWANINVFSILNSEI